MKPTKTVEQLRGDLLRIADAGIRAVDPARLVAERLRRLRVSAPGVWLIAAGKASQAMARTAVDILGGRLAGGVVVVPPGGVPVDGLTTVAGEHPQPGPGSERAGRHALSLAQSVPVDGELIVMISGGASSLLAVPAGGLTLDDKRAATGVLLRSGADIQSLNTVRKHMSAVKGGRLATACPGRSHTFVLSDVVGDDLSVIASGPTVADSSTYADALAVLDRFGGRAAYPTAVIAHLEAGVRGERPESPKPGDARLSRATTELIGGRHEAMRGAVVEAQSCGYHVVVVDEAIVGEARVAGEELAHRFRHAAVRVPACFVASGETTVHVTGSGKGGRNQEMALAAMRPLSETGQAFAFCSLGTDGIDGPTDAAGAIVDTTSQIRAADARLPDPAAFFDDNNAYAFFDALGDLIRIGPTGTNVGDLQVCLIA